MSRQKLSEKFPTDEAGLSATDTKAGKLQRACLDLLREHERDGAIPTNAKFLFYEAEQRGVVPKHYLDERGHKKPRQPLQDITDALTYLRERDIIPWWWIEDPSRVLDDWMFATSVYAYVADAMGRARIDVWKGEPPPLSEGDFIVRRGHTKGIAKPRKLPGRDDAVPDRQAITGVE